MIKSLFVMDQESDDKLLNAKDRQSVSVTHLKLNIQYPPPPPVTKSITKVVFDSEGGSYLLHFIFPRFQRSLRSHVRVVPLLFEPTTVFGGEGDDGRNQRHKEGFSFQVQLGNGWYRRILNCSVRGGSRPTH